MGDSGVGRRSSPGGRAARTGLLAAAVAAVVALDLGVVPLPYSTPVDRPPGTVSAPGRTAAGQETFDRDAEINSVLAAMSGAYADDDERAFTAAVDPRQAGLLTRVRTLYRNLKAIGYDDVSLSTRDPARPVAGAERAAVVAQVWVRTRLPGFDRGASRTLLSWTFARRGDRWLLVADRDGTARPDAAEPWQVGPVEVVRRKEVLVIGEPARRAALRRLADRLQDARSAVRDVWRVPSWNGRVVAYAVTDDDFVDHHFAGREATGKRTKQARFDAKVTLLDPADGTVVMPRLVVSPYLLQRDGAESAAVLTHELTHVAWAGEGGPSVPAWLVEGVAEYTGFRTGGSAVDGVGALGRRGLPRELWGQLRRGGWQPALVTDPDAFYAGSANRVATAYTGAWLTCLFIADRYGEQKLAALYTAAGSGGPGEDPVAAETRILRTVLNTDRARLSQDVARYAERIRRSFV